jgi:regulator of replication initiation timing
MSESTTTPAPTQPVDIVQLMETRPLTRFSDTCQHRLMTKMRVRFTNTEQQLFLMSFYCYLNYEKTDFVVDLDNIWKWLGFSTKGNASRLLKKYFTEDVDYKLSLLRSEKQSVGRGGLNKETILLTIKAFKSFCLKAGTSKADQIHEYYINLEEMLQDVIYEESNELRNLLEDKTQQLEDIHSITKNEKIVLREKTILDQFPKNTQCVYYGIIDNKSSDNEPLIKFGNSNNLHERVKSHKKNFDGFFIINAFKVENKMQVENAIKFDPLFMKYRRSKNINGKNQTELLVINELTFDKIDETIKSIISNIEYTPENYAKLLNERDALNKRCIFFVNEIERLKEEKDIISRTKDANYSDELSKIRTQVVLLTEENQKLKIENIKLIRKYKLDKKITYDDTNTVYDTSIPEIIPDVQYDNITNSLKRIAKSPDGFYYIGNFKYKSCFGTREEVWNRTAYKTTGELTRERLMMNKSGKIISKKKFIQEKEFYRLEKLKLEKQENSS